MKIQIRLFNKVFVLQGLVRDSKNKDVVVGYTNRCTDGKYIVCLDYDNAVLNWVEEELLALQNQFKLGDFYIFESSKDSYHAVCFDKVVISELLQIFKNSSVDPNYINVPLRFGKKLWTLRLSDKDNIPVKFLKKIKSGNYLHETSSAHADMINKLFNIPFYLYKPDFEQKLILARYPI